MRPSERIPESRAEILAIAARHGACDVKVFGSVARGQDTETSDLDLIVTFDADRSLVDLISLEEELREFLGFHVDIISSGSTRVVKRAKEAVAL